MKRTLMLAALFAAGCAAALSLGVHRASAWGPNDLPPGWTIEGIHSIGATVCPSSYRIWTTNRASWSDPFCMDSATYQADFDAWVNSHYTPPPPSTTAETVPPVTTTIVITTTTPAATTTATTTSGPATATDPSAPAPEPAPVAVTNTVTITTTVTPVEQSLQAQIDALAAQLATLTDRVTRLEKAGDAAWLAFQQSIANGDDVATAADVARGTYLNALYGLGEFTL